MKAIQLPSGSWNVRVRNGKTIKSFTASTRREAERMAAEYLLDKDRKERLGITVGEAIDSYIESKRNILSPTTISLYEIIRKKNMQGIMTIPLSVLTNIEIQKEINREAETHKPKTLANMRGLLSASLKQYGFDVDVSVPHPVKKIIDLPDPSDVMKAVKGKDIELPTLLAMWLSLSMSEIRGLSVESVSDGFITVCESVVDVDGQTVHKEATKAYERTRRLSLPSEIRTMIEQTDAWKKGEGYLVPINRRLIYARFTKAISDAGLPHMTFHQLRHMNASVMEQIGVPLLYAKERGGWNSNSQTLQRVYQHTFKDKKSEVDEQINSHFSSIYKGIKA